jgi:transcriptional regulator with XRE-family HTH domain
MGEPTDIVTSIVTKELREAVRIEMMRQNITGIELAAKAGMSRQYLSQMLRGHVDGSVDTWRRILDSLGLELKAVKRQ